MSRRAAAAAALAALAAGAGAIVLGRAVLAEGARLDRARSSLAVPRTTVQAPGGGVAAALLRDGADRASLAAAADYARAAVRPAPASVVRAEQELVQVAAAGPAARRAWASTLVGLLELAQARLGGPTATRHVDAAAGALEAAVATGAASEEAKRDLELLLTLRQHGRPRASARKRGSSSRPGHSHRTRANGRAHAAFAPPGSGW